MKSPLLQPVFATLTVLFLTVSASASDFASLMRQMENAQADATARVIVELQRPSDFNSRPVYEQRQMVSERTAQVLPALRAAGVNSAESLNSLPFVIATVNRAQLEALGQQSDVIAVYENRVERKALASSVPSIGVDQVWDQGYDGAGYAVAVIDGGFDADEPVFSGRVVAEACFATQSAFFNTTTQCPSGQTPEIGAGAASNCPIDSDRCNHGTHVASTAAGNTGSIQGVARGADLVLIDVFSAVDDEEDCGDEPTPCQLTDSGAVLRALDYVNENAAELNIAAVNLSLGGGEFSETCPSDSRTSVVAALSAKGIAVVAATGNDGFDDMINSPACVPGVISVGATNDSSTVAGFSNIASFVTLMAPGANIVAPGPNGTLFQASGTSMSAPHVAGSYAILRQLAPTATLDELTEALTSTGTLVQRTGVASQVPRINVDLAAAMLLDAQGVFLNNVFTSRQNTGSRSFLRFYNRGASEGEVEVALINVITGREIRTWTSPAVPPNASLQFGIDRLDGALSAFDDGRDNTYFNLRVRSGFTGFLQHVIFNSVEAGFSDMTSCVGGASVDATSLTNVHTSQLASYSSFIRILNTSATSTAATLSFFSASTGEELFQWTSTDIPSNGAIEVAVDDIEAVSLFTPTAVSDSLVHYNVELDTSDFEGLIQHVVRNPRGVVSDLSRKCAF